MVLTFPELGRAGRLGNQLFQIASTVGLSIVKNCSPRFPEWDYAPFFCVPDEYFDKYDDLVMLATDNVMHIDERERIYLQDHHLFHESRDLIKDIFSPSECALDILESRLDELNALTRPILSIHARRGDILKHPTYHPTRSLDYYKRAFESVDAGSVAVFSDDLDWCERVLAPSLEISFDFFGSRSVRSPDPGQYEVQGPIDWQDLFLMMECDFHILSNSTYSWWGAYLSADESPIYPSNWYGPSLRHVQVELLFPDSWTEVYDPTEVSRG